MLMVVYAQALFGIIPIGRADPTSRLLGFGMRDVGASIERIRAQTDEASILTTDYESASWLAFYGRRQAPLLALDQEHRWVWSGSPPRAFLSKPMLYVVESRHDQHALLASQFSQVVAIGAVVRRRGQAETGKWVLYRLTGFHGVEADYTEP
jgi:hypothetical protein